MTDPVGNLPAQRLYSKFGFKQAILGDTSIKRGHMCLFQFSEESLVLEFLKRHPFTEHSISSSKVDFHGRMLHLMAWKDTQTKEKLALYIEGQPSQTPKGTMSRICGVSCDDIGIEALVREESKTITQGGNTKFAISIWNLSSKPLEIPLNVSIPEGTILNPLTQYTFLIKINPAKEKNIHFELTWSSSCKLPDFTTFSTVLATVFFAVEGITHPLFVSAGFDKI
jgi:hypothetical protein